MSPRLATLVARVFAVPAASIDPESGPHNLAQWDSAGHLNLVLALEKEFGVQFEDDEVVELVSMAAIVEALARHGVQA